jgi:hypothetical protein
MVTFEYRFVIFLMSGWALKEETLSSKVALDLNLDSFC